MERLTRFILLFSLQLFGEAVLGLSQGSVSELLCKPKPWHMLSIKGREPFIRMQLWLSDPNNTEKLHALKAEQDLNRSNMKRKHAGGADSDSNPGSPHDSYHNPAADDGSESPTSKKQPRVFFSVRQKEALKIAFSLDPYPSPSAMEFLSMDLNLESRSISNWFHNHRMRLKQTHPHDIDSLIPPSPKDDHHQQRSSSFDPLHFRLRLNQRLLELEQQQQQQHERPSSPSSPPVSPPSSESKLPIISLDLSSTSSTASCGDQHRASLLARSSRRKPLAPQWVNPTAMLEQGLKIGDGKEEEIVVPKGDQSEEAINGPDPEESLSVGEDASRSSAGCSPLALSVKQDDD